LITSIHAAFWAMLLIGTADAINKRARQYAVPIGSYLIIQTIFFSLTILLMALWSDSIRWQHADLFYGLLGAIFGFTGFTLMLHSLTHGHASVNYAIFRSSFVFSTAAAVLLLGEELSLTKIVGIALACSAIFLFFIKPQPNVTKSKSLVVALIAMLVAAGFQLTLKLSTRSFSSPLSFILLMNIFFAFFAIIYNILFGNFRFPRATFRFAPINGILMAVATFFYVTALQKGELSTAMPIIQLSFIVTAILSAIFLKEKIDTLKTIGIVCAAVAIIVLGIL